MTGAQLLDMVMQRLGNRTDATLRAALAVEMAAAQEFVLEQMDFVPWFLLSENTSTTTTATEPRLALPSDFIMEDEDGALIYETADGVKTLLPKDEFDYAIEYFADTAVGPPQAYALVGDYFYLFPTPDAAYTINLRYFAHDTAPTDTGTTNKWLSQAAMLLLAETGRVGASLYIQNQELAISFTEEYKRQKDLLWKKHEARMIVNRDIRMGGVA